MEFMCSGLLKLTHFYAQICLEAFFNLCLGVENLISDIGAYGTL